MNGNAYDAEPKRVVRKRELLFLKRELTFWQQARLIDDRQASAIGDLYRPSKGHFSQVLLGLGAMLIGLGFLSTIAANWAEFSRAFKVALVLSAYIGAILSAWSLEPSYPRTSRALLLLGSFIYGGGIFLIAQIFNEGGHYTTALFWWMAGIAPVVWVFKDRLQLILLQTVALVYFHGVYEAWRYVDGYGYAERTLAVFFRGLVWPAEPLTVLAALWTLWWRLDKRWSLGFKLNVFILFNFVGIHAIRYFHDITLLLILFACLGAVLCVCAAGYWREELSGWGVALVGSCGLILTLPEIWKWSRIMREDMLFGLASSFPNTRPEVALAVGTGLLVCLLLLWFVRKGSVLATAFFCLLILRFYFDRFYDFMPKALFFTVGGVLLAGLGFFLEHVRKKKKGAGS